MNNSTLLNNLTKAIACAYDDTAETVKILTNIKNIIIDEIINEAKNTPVKKSERTKIKNIFNFVLKNSIKEMAARPGLHRIVEDGGNYVVTDGFQIYVSTIKPEAEVVPVDDTYVKWRRFFENLDYSKFTKIDLPEQVILKDIISSRKALNKTLRTKLPAVFEIDGIRNNINANYLLKAIQAGITELYFNDNTIFYGKNEDGTLKCLICGMTKPEKAKQDAEIREKEREKEKADREKKEREFVEKENKQYHEIIDLAISKIKTTGKIRNETIRMYDSAYHHKDYKLFNYLFNLYGIKIPIKLSGWINSALMYVKIEDGEYTGFEYYAAHNKSTKIGEYMEKLITAIKEDK